MRTSKNDWRFCGISKKIKLGIIKPYEICVWNLIQMPEKETRVVGSYFKVWYCYSCYTFIIIKINIKNVQFKRNNKCL